MKKYLEQGEELLEAAENLVESGITSKIQYDALMKRPKSEECHLDNNIKKIVVTEIVG